MLERVAYSRAELAERLPALRAASRARGVAVLSTCQRTEVYATWAGEPDEAALLAAVASDRIVSRRSLRRVSTTFRDEAAARHLMRVTCGLESFVLGETEIVGQVRTAADVSQIGRASCRESVSVTICSHFVQC